MQTKILGSRAIFFQKSMRDDIFYFYFLFFTLKKYTIYMAILFLVMMWEGSFHFYCHRKSMQGRFLICLKIICASSNKMFLRTKEFILHGLACLFCSIFSLWFLELFVILLFCLIFFCFQPHPSDYVVYFCK